MYAPIIKWLKATLKGVYPGHSQQVLNTSRIKLQTLVEKEGMQKFFPQFPTYEIMVDLTTILQKGDKAKLGFVECKLGPILLKDIGQLMAYAMVARPVFALLISPSGLSEGVRQLLQIHQRYDILQYAPGKIIKIGIWDLEREEVVPRTVIPPGDIF